MHQAALRPEQTATAPQGFRDALAELVQIGLRVARMVGRVADAETELAEAASQASAMEGVSALAGSLAEAIEADRAAAAAAESRQTIAARTEAVADAFALVSRAIRLTVMLAERLDRGWARGGAANDQPPLATRQMGRLAADTTGREAEGEREVARDGERAERLEALDTEAGIGTRSAQAVIDAICRDLGLDPVRATLRSPLPGAIKLTEVWSFAEAGGAPPLAAGTQGWALRPPQRRPDG